MTTRKNKTTPRRTASKVKITKTKRATKTAGAKNASTKTTNAKTLTSVDVAKLHDMNPKTLRARIRRNIEQFEPLFLGGDKHKFPDNQKTRDAIADLLKV